MSRIGLNPISIPASVTITIAENKVVVQGPLGQLTQDIHPAMKVVQADAQLRVSRMDDSKLSRSLHGLTRSLLANNVIGVTTGFQKRLEMIGTGYRVAKSGNNLTLQVGYSHPVEITPAAGITFEVEGQNKIVVKGSDKHAVGQVAAEIRAVRKPEPYKGKGIRYEGEVVRRKAGKAAKVGGAA